MLCTKQCSSSPGWDDRLPDDVFSVLYEGVCAVGNEFNDFHYMLWSLHRGVGELLGRDSFRSLSMIAENAGNM